MCGELLVFDRVSRTDLDYAYYAEPSFVHLNRSARPEVEKVRDLVEAWFSNYPAEHRASLRTRFRSRNDVDHLSAFFELFLYELLSKFGYSMTIHPDVPSSNKHPEFLVEGAGTNFYLEATLAGESRLDAAARARTNLVYDALDKLESPHFFVGMELQGSPKTPPPADQLRSFLSRHLRELDLGKVREAFGVEGIDGLPRWRYEHDGWKIVFFPIPKGTDGEDEVCIRPLGAFFYEAKTIDAASIKAALQRKAGRYGDPDLPYVIAVNSLRWLPDHLELDALFGTRQLDFDREMNYVGERRLGDGLWGSPSNKKNTRVSAVLVLHRLSPWNVSEARICLYVNPWARRPHVSQLSRLPRFVPEGEKMRLEAGEPLGALLQLPHQAVRS